jgi:hypothetical protein
MKNINIAQNFTGSTNGFTPTQMPLIDQASASLQGLLLDKYGQDTAVTVGVCAATATTMMGLALKSISQNNVTNTVLDNPSPTQIIDLSAEGKGYQSYGEYAVHVENTRAYYADGQEFTSQINLLNQLFNKAQVIDYTDGQWRTAAGAVIEDYTVGYCPGHYLQGNFDTYEGQFIALQNSQSNFANDVINAIENHNGAVVAVYAPNWLAVDGNGNPELDLHALTVQSIWGTAGSYTFTLQDPWARVYTVKQSTVTFPKLNCPVQPNPGYYPGATYPALTWVSGAGGYVGSYINGGDDWTGQKTTYATPIELLTAQPFLQNDAAALRTYYHLDQSGAASLTKGATGFLAMPNTANLTSISVGVDGTAWGLNANHNIFSYNAATNSWNPVPGTLSQLSIANSSTIWGVNSGNGQAYTWRSGGWVNIPSAGGLTQISAAPDGTVWALNYAGAIYAYSSSSQSFVSVPGTLSQISVGNANSVWGVNSAGAIYHFNTTTKGWNRACPTFS